MGANSAEGPGRDGTPVRRRLGGATVEGETCPLVSLLGSSETCPNFVTFRVDGRERLERLLGLASSEEGIETITIADPCQEATNPTFVDLGTITEKQWRALEVAKQVGHYDGSRGGSLEVIADELDISKSAASQRLRAAEAKLVSSLLGTTSITCSPPGERRSSEAV